jgi:hypothetical protein
MAPTDEKTEVVLPAEVPDDLPLPSDQKAAWRRIAAQGEPLWKTTRSAEKSFANGWPSEGQAQTEEQVAAFAKKAVQQNEFDRSRRDAGPPEDPPAEKSPAPGSPRGSNGPTSFGSS